MAAMRSIACSRGKREVPRFLMCVLWAVLSSSLQPRMMALPLREDRAVGNPSVSGALSTAGYSQERPALTVPLTAAPHGLLLVAAKLDSSNEASVELFKPSQTAPRSPALSAPQHQPPWRLSTGVMPGAMYSDTARRMYGGIHRIMHSDMHSEIRRKATEHKEQAQAAPRPTETACSFVVGRGQKFQRIQDAINSVGQNPASKPVTICIRPGLYRERLHIQSGQDGITLQGHGNSTVVEFPLSKSQTGDPFEAATVTVEGTHFSAKYMVVRNTGGNITDPCPAVTLRGQRTTWHAVELSSWSDTVAVAGGNSHLFKGCVISGLTDVTWGFGRAAFVDTEFRIKFWYDPKILYTGDLATFGTDPQGQGVKAGTVFWRCKIVGKGRAYLGRPYRPRSTTVFVDTWMGKAVPSPGWDDYNGYITARTFDYREYNSRGPGASNRRRYGRVLHGKVPGLFTVHGFIGRAS